MSGRVVCDGVVMVKEYVYLGQEIMLVEGVMQQ